ncbi:MAG: FkbM family methyltransferase [Methylocystis sp.]|nr:FkbM family methyltransferase [Methylocystis sp.]
MFISYASNFEDVLLNRVFRDQESGFYIDIGADHPVAASTTKIFYDRGWSGINFEPGPNFALLEQERPRDINLKAVVVDHDGEVDFYVNDDLTATSSIHEALHPAVQARVSQRTKVRIQAFSLNTIVRKYVKNDVHFLKIDAEGAEGAIIGATDWVNFRPVLILAESTEPFSTNRIDQEWSDVLRRGGYIEVYFDGINTWFLREENKELAEHFRIPVNLLDDFIDYEKSLLRGSVEEFSRASQAPSQARQAPRPLLQRIFRKS